MKPIDPLNSAAIHEIENRKHEMNEFIKLAENMEACGYYHHSLKFYEKARHSSYHVGKGLKVIIINEQTDLDNWHRINKKVPLRDINNEIIGLLGISFDITDRKKMEQELLLAKEAAEAASHAKTEFIANMGHDIRTPLTGIIGFSRFLEEEIQNPEEKEYAQQIHQSGEQLLGLLNGVLDLITADSTNEDQVLHQFFDVRRALEILMPTNASCHEASYF